MPIYPDTANVQTTNVSFFGWPEDLTDVVALKLMLDISSAYQFQLDYGVLSTPTSDNVRVLNARNAIKMVNEGERNSHDYIKLYQARSGSKSDWRWISSVDYSTKLGRKRFAVRASLTDTTDHVDYFDKAINLCLQVISPQYGYVSKLPLNWDPSAYDSGTLHGQDDEDERRRITDWRNECIWRLGGSRYDVLRDVYPINFLNAHHLGRQLDGRTVAEWISDTKVGSLNPLGKGLWKWDLTPDQASRARPLLLMAGHLASKV